MWYQEHTSGNHVSEPFSEKYGIMGAREGERERGRDWFLVNGEGRSNMWHRRNLKVEIFSLSFQTPFSVDRTSGRRRRKTEIRDEVSVDTATSLLSCQSLWVSFLLWTVEERHDVCVCVCVWVSGWMGVASWSLSPASNSWTNLSLLLCSELTVSVTVLLVRLTSDQKMSGCVEKEEDRTESSVSSCLSMKSDQSKDPPQNFSNEPGPSDTK